MKIVDRCLNQHSALSNQRSAFSNWRLTMNYGFVTRCAPIGAASSSGSSGITSHAMG